MDPLCTEPHIASSSEEAVNVQGFCGSILEVRRVFQRQNHTIVCSNVIHACFPNSPSYSCVFVRFPVVFIFFHQLLLELLSIPLLSFPGHGPVKEILVGGFGTLRRNARKFWGAWFPGFF